MCQGSLTHDAVKALRVILNFASSRHEKLSAIMLLVLIIQTSSFTKVERSRW